MNVKMSGMLLLAACLFIAADDAKEAAKKEHAKFLGTWTAVSVELNGNKQDDDTAKLLSVVYEAEGKWILNFGGNQIATGTLTLDPTKKPKEVDYTYTDDNGEKKVLKGIYEIDGDTYRACYAKPGDEKRPTEFVSKSDSGHTLSSYKREKK